VVVATASLAAVLTANDSQADAVALGQNLYVNYCQSCHGEGAAGLNKFTGDLSVFRQRMSGNDTMPDMTGLLTAEEIAAVFAFVAAQR